MDLPTFTSIWRIEKRLYKIYDFNLPMPLPMAQVGVFVGVSLGWVLLLQLIRVPFQTPWHVLYLVPPGVVTYLATRPVLEGKRLTEILLSQLRYLAEPRTWCRLTAVHEPAKVTVLGTVWRRVERPPTTPEEHARARGVTPRPVRHPAGADRVPTLAAYAAAPAEHPPAEGGGHGSAGRELPARATPRFRPATDGQGPRARPPALPAASSTPAQPPPPEAPTAQPPQGPVPSTAPQSRAEPQPQQPAESRQRPAEPQPQQPAESRQRSRQSRPQAGAGKTVLRTPPAHPGEGVSGASGARSPWRRLTEAIGASQPHQPGADGSAASDMIDRVQAPFRGARRVLVLGCAGDAGQTVTALMLGHTLAVHRRDRCIAVDAGTGEESLARRSRMETPETLTSLLARLDSVTGYLGIRAYTSQAASGLEVVASGEDAALLTSLGTGDFAAVAAALDRYYRVTLFDPDHSVLSRALPVADRLVLVARATPNAAATTNAMLTWLERHGYGRLASESVLVLNGVRRDSVADVERAEGNASGRCAACVRVPADDRLNAKGGRSAGAPAGRPAELDRLHGPTRQSYLHLAATLAAGFSAVPERYHQEAPR